MKEVIKVSIGNLAFTLEKDAFRVINDYLDVLKHHYRNHENGSEIIDGIEERMADLFLERIVSEGVVSAGIANEVVEILGRPEDIDDEAGKDTIVEKKVPKRVYRDLDNKTFGGVCSGLAAYFNIDVTFVRVVFVVLFLLLALTSLGAGGGWVIFVYIILWLVIPKARTVEQRYAMRGETPSVMNVQRQVESSLEYEARERRGRGTGKIVGRVLGVGLGLFLILIGITGIFSLLLTFFGIQAFYGVAVQFPFPDTFFNASSGIDFWFKVSFWFTFFLPFLGMLYGGTRLVFNFNSPCWRPGLVIFILWVLALFSTAIFGVKSAKNHYWGMHVSTKTDSAEFVVGDTLYVKYNEPEGWKGSNVALRSDGSGIKLMLDEGKKKNKDARIVIYPEVKVRKNQEEESERSSKLSISRLSLDRKSFEEKRSLDFYHFANDTLYLEPIVFQKGKRGKGFWHKLELTVPEVTIVIIEEPKPKSYEVDLSIEI